MKVDLDAMGRLRAEKVIRINRHPELPLLILNYTPRCQYEGLWTSETLMCRGLVVDLDGNIIARSFPKFFNWEEHENNPALPRVEWNQGFVATEKLDGSLGILFHAHGQWHLATRGSLVSEQAAEGMRIWRDRGYRDDSLDPGWSYLFEIISPWTKVVVDYGTTRELVLLEAVRASSGESPPFAELARIGRRIGCRSVRQFVMPPPQPGNLADLCASSARNAEGVVIRFDDGVRVKAKFAEYKRLHRLVTGVNSRVVWEMLRDGRPLDELLDRVPDEFNAWLRKTADGILSEYRGLEDGAHRVFREVSARLDEAPRRDYAAEFVPEKILKAVLFRMLDGKPYDEILWKIVRPEHALPFREDEE